ncbi:putative polyketide synthase [Aspergillus nomiae NRRL 13137]|uniref:Putative polyketide synthase n=1 Tax=Aspergillus nomiae NRRL (strain ATCC 15546 / NRRL 13137 / CBS 260.88 / M93) TaxID=1509407 RepID=A0A0L1J643_ASPN3|nr:putative polyketide synthase [Aspergillus nomiae NRRL 13137]KNG87291.1 putative polyketide synthase [Aspergillus nomiae NRRL 13137]
MQTWPQETQGTRSHSEPLAIVGFALRFPDGVASDDEFWDMIWRGRSATSNFPGDRLSIDGFYHPDKSRQSTLSVKGGNFIHGDLAAFDAPFFSISPAEAACMDPQHRLLLETAYHALEDAGVPMEKCSGSDTSVYTGSFTNDYLSILQQDYDAEQRHAAMGIATCMLANRISWFFNLKGTSMNIDTACSSSLIALHLACQDLRAGTASMALVGGANLVFHPQFMKVMSNANFLTPDSQCWSFDERANGYARGEGIAMLVVKRLKDALHNGDTIRAVIRNTGSNQDGRTPGITQPCLESQIALIKETYRRANIDMQPTRFFETHGTGTSVGDPIEATAIGRAFSYCRTSHDPLYLGAVKANIGHLEGCSGLAGVIKTLLVLENGVIPPIAKFKTASKHIDTEALPICFPTSPLAWPKPGLRRACVNSFGFGGTNTIVILDDVYNYLQLNGLHGHHRTCQGMYDEQVIPYRPVGQAATVISSNDGPSGHLDVAQVPRLLVWSATRKDGAEALSDSFCKLFQQAQCDLDDLAYTLSAKRSHLSWRGFTISGGSDNQLCTSRVKADTPLRANEHAGVAFIFTGQGGQYHGMGRELFLFPEFKRSVALSEECLKRLNCTWSLYRLLSVDNCDLQIDNPKYSQPLSTCIQIALIDYLTSIGVTPTVVLGHSSGEIAAAYAAGALSRFSAIKVAYYRGILSSKLAANSPAQTMMAVRLSKDDIIPYIQRLREQVNIVDVVIGCVNSPHSITLSGGAEQLDMVRLWLEQDDIFARKLRVSVAYHSSTILNIADEYRLVLGSLERGQESGSVRMFSSVTGHAIAVDVLGNAEYWVRNMYSRVEFDRAMANLLIEIPKRPGKQLGRSNASCNTPVTHLLEIGPHCVLQGPISDCLQSSSIAKKPSYIPSLIRGENAHYSLLRTIGKLHCAGVQVDLLKANLLDETPRPIPKGMPRYPFDHTRSYWKESRLSRNFRFRLEARHDLLGTRTLDWNPREARWRNTLRVSEMPWLRDHRVEGRITLPAAAMIVMAVEALQQLIEDTASIANINFQSVSFLHPIRISEETDQVETQFTISSEHSTITHTTWSRFRLFTIENGSYVECCNGIVRAFINYNEEQTSANPPIRIPFATQGVASWVKEVRDGCRVPEVDVYARLQDTTVEYGPCFRNLQGVRVGDKGEAIAEVQIDTWKSRTRTDTWPQKYAVHPCTIDGLAQIVFPALMKEGHVIPTMVPTLAASIWINYRRFQLLQEGSLKVSAKCSMRGARGSSANIVATSTGSNELPLLYIEGLEATFLGGLGSSRNEGKALRNLCSRLLWRPDLDLMSLPQLERECSRERPEESKDAVQYSRSLKLAIMSFIEDAMSKLSQSGSLSIPPELKLYVAWIKHQQQRPENAGLRMMAQRLIQNRSEHDKLVAQVEEANVEGQFFMHIGKNLTGVLSGIIDPLELMFGNGLADRYYQQMLGNPYHTHPVKVYLDHLCFKNPSMNFLEIGAGTGGQTLCVLEAITSNGLKRCARYDYTDISPAFFVNARERFRDYADIMRFQAYDLSRDPISQAFQKTDYDVIVASHVLHAVENLDQALQNIRKLLKPDGRLLLFETTDPDCLPIGFAFGLLKGWWSPLGFESRSQHSPCLTTAQWDDRLKNAGFSGLDLKFEGQQDRDYQYSSIMISRAAAHVNGVADQNEVSDIFTDIAVMIDREVEDQYQVAASLEERFIDIHTYTLHELATKKLSPSTLLVSLLQLQKPFLDNISRDNFGMLQSVLLALKNTLWITQAQGETTPNQCLVEGFGRSLASEDPTRMFVTLALDGSDMRVKQRSDVISLVVNKIKDGPKGDLEANLIVKDGLLHIPRVSEGFAMNETVSQANQKYQQQLWQLPSKAQASIVLDSPGPKNIVGFCEEPLDTHALSDDELIVEVKAIGLSFRDYLAAIGELDNSELGMECAGIVQKVGRKSCFNLGDRVCLIGTSMARTSVRIRADAARALPADMTFIEAASLPCAVWLAYHSIVRVAAIQKGESLLICQGSSAVAQMAMQLALIRGARVFSLVSSESKRSFVSEVFGIGQGGVFLTHDPSMSSKLHEVTEGNGFDIIFGSLADYSMIDFYEYLAPHGRLLDTSLKRSSVNGRSPMPRTQVANVTQASINLAGLLRTKASAAYQIFQEAMESYFSQSLKPPQPLNILPATDVETIFQKPNSSTSIGKNIVELSNGATIAVNVSRKPAYCFSDAATYVIAGGLGGLGRSIARWMVSRGARHLVLLSRSGRQSQAAKSLLHELEAQGVQTVAPRVDIGDFAGLKEIIGALSVHMPPFRGCIQATMVLKDNLFENMSHDDWTQSTQSKVAGSWNLHRLLPQGMDFFILLSSVNGSLGGMGQANYAAGNTFQDALAKYRISAGEKAVALDLGLMVSEGLVAENKSLLASLRSMGHLMDISQDELIALLDYYCNPTLPLLSHDEAQILVGIELPSNVRAKGNDLQHFMRRPMFRHLFAIDRQLKGGSFETKASTMATAIDRQPELRAVDSQDEAVSLVTSWIRVKLEQIMGIPGAEINAEKPVSAHGMDSLMALDLKNWFHSEIGVDLTIFDIMSSMDLNQLAGMVVCNSRDRE